jgi:lipopolysaccharide biosynthesis protein
VDDRRFLAFYLPQYHPIPENDEWWGTGFTEWRNVAKARPLFKDHYQPHLPADLGFYDLRLPEVREHQAALARRYGIDGFVYYHYWFHGRRLLERPFDEVLASGSPDLPFALCWANENWTRAWDGGLQKRLLGQSYCADDDRRHIQALAPAFRDPRYITVDGKPLFLVYRLSELPDPRRTAEIWREEMDRMGFPGIYLARVEAWASDTEDDPRDVGFDAGVEFQPDSRRLGSEQFWSRPERLARRVFKPNSPLRHHCVYDYGRIVDLALSAPAPTHPRFPCVTPGWDNSPRRREWARIVHGSTPELYERWLRATLERTAPYSAEENFVFVNAWNEWGEGCHLEPDQRWGHAYLEAHQRAAGRVTAAETTVETASIGGRTSVAAS